MLPHQCVCPWAHRQCLFQLKPTHQPKCTHLSSRFCNGIMPTLQRCSESGWKQWQLALCGLPLPAGPVGRSSQHQPAELLRGVLEFTRVIITLCSMALRGSLYVCVHIYVCVSRMMACVVLGTVSRSIVSESLTSPLIHILVWASLLFVLTFQRGKHKHTVNC